MDKRRSFILTFPAILQLFSDYSSLIIDSLGVSYLSPFEEAALRKSRPSRTAESESKIELNEADAAYIDHTRSFFPFTFIFWWLIDFLRTVLDEFLANQKTSVDLMEVEGNHADAKDEKKEKTENQDSQHEEKDIENTLPPNQLFLPQPNSYKRKMIYDEIGRSYSFLSFLSSGQCTHFQAPYPCAKNIHSSFICGHSCHCNECERERRTWREREDWIRGASLRFLSF